MGSDTILGQAFAGVPEDLMIPTMVGYIIGCLFAAFFSFRFFKLSIVLMGLAVGYTFGAETLGMLISDRITDFNASLVLGIACGVVCAILAPKFYKLCIHLIGGIIGYIIGDALFYGVVAGMGYETPGLIVGIVAGLVAAFFGAKLLYRFFKPYLIISSAFAGSMLAAIATATLLFGDGDGGIVVFAILGGLLSVVAMFAQFRMNANRDLDL